ncbi:MAG TPA: VOC family protein, partial [Propionicimonas sp.]
MPITHVQLLSLPVSDQDRAKAFYVDGLGFELISDTEMKPGMRWVLVRPVGAQTAITLVTWFPTMPAGSARGLVLETDDLDAEIASLRDRGVAIDGDVERAPWGRFVQLTTPTAMASSCRSPRHGRELEGVAVARVL